MLYQFCFVDGQHGYNNSLKSMHPIFLAMGPSFKKGATVDTFNNVDVYPLLCKILGLKPAPNNGSLEKVSHLLVDRLIDESNESAFWICKYSKSGIFHVNFL